MTLISKSSSCSDKFRFFGNFGVFFAPDDDSLSLGLPRGRPVGCGVDLGPFAFLGGRPTGRGVLTTTVLAVGVGGGERS